ncbi:MAG: HNH endonuclease signature motif containing protein [Mycobacterium sp.]
MFDKRLHDYFAPTDCAESRALIADLAVAARLENQAAARKLKYAGELFELRRAERGETEDWAVDTWAAVGAEIAAFLRISLGKAGSFMNYGIAMQRLPAVAAVFVAGDIDLQTFSTIVYRTDLITDAAAMAEVDACIAVWVSGWSSMGRGRLTREIDHIVARNDPDAVRRVNERARGREVTFWDAQDGTADMSGRLFAADAELLDKRLDALAATTCEGDPRTIAQRRADAVGALAAGAERLMCRCGSGDCAAGAAVASSVVIHVVAKQETLDGESNDPGHLIGSDALITAELLRDLATQAKLRPLIHPADSPAENRYRPSLALADFVRARDLTCRAPGCNRPATNCDLDHTIPFPHGATHASNLKCLCRLHHLLKTFWGWRDYQLPDGTVMWTLPDGQTYVTTPGSALLFPGLTAPTGPCSGRTAMMPLRKTTRAHNRAARIAAERASPPTPCSGV